MELFSNWTTIKDKNQTFFCNKNENFFFPKLLSNQHWYHNRKSSICLFSLNHFWFFFFIIIQFLSMLLIWLKSEDERVSRLRWFYNRSYDINFVSFGQIFYEGKNFLVDLVLEIVKCLNKNWKLDLT